MSLVTGVTDASASLDDVDIETLARMANEENRLVEECIAAALSDFSEGLAHAMRCGELLVALQERVNTSKWAQWVAENLTFRPKTAVAYVRVYTYRDQLPSAQMTLGAALAHLRGLPPTGLRKGRPKQYPDEVRDEAVRLRRSGLSLDQVAEVLDVKRGTVDYWSNPKTRKRSQGNAKRRNREITAALQAQRRAETVKAAGGSIKRAHALVLRLTRELDVALRDATDTEIRNALRASYSAATRCEAEILRAVRGVS